MVCIHVSTLDYVSLEVGPVTSVKVASEYVNSKQQLARHPL